MAVLRVCGSHFVNAKYGYSIITDDLFMLTFYFNESLKSKENCFEHQIIYRNSLSIRELCSRCG